MLDLIGNGAVAEDAPVDRVLGRVLEQLAGLVARLRPGVAWTTRHFVPRGARTVSRRLFVELDIDGGPTWIAKVPLNPSDAMVDREWEVLSRQAWTRPVFETPTPVERLDSGFVMSWVPRVDFPEVLSAAGAEAPGLLIRAADAVAALHEHGHPFDGDARPLVEEYLGARYRELPASLVKTLSHTRIGLFHGDLGPWNLRAGDGGRLGLVDWEDCQERGVQAIDVLNLAMTSVLAADSGYRSRDMASLVGEMLDPASPMGAAIVEALRNYAAATDQCVREVGSLVPLFCLWMEERIRRQGRATDHLFYRPLHARFLQEGRAWAMELGR
ncbi:phosphotransferase [Streptomyces sp. SS8]